MELEVRRDALMVFVDETGDEAFTDPLNPIFGIGGCAFLARDIENNVRQPWARVRRAFGAREGVPLHASKAQRRCGPRQNAALIDFFRQQPIGRFAVIAKADTIYEIGDVAEHVTMVHVPAMLYRVVDIARWSAFSAINVVVEHSARLGPKIERASQNLTLHEGERPIPIEWYFMGKRAAEPALEIADFIMHAAAGHLREGKAVSGKFFERASAIFKPEDPRLVSYMEIDRVVATPDRN
ncbi:MAG: DUF3800 domain-containing protein [Alphaproteobacteria bacterium]